jgi:predicted nucleic acid-binding protein
MIVALDTCILLFALKDGAPPDVWNDEDRVLVPRVMHFLADLKARRARILIPAPVISEALVRRSPAEHPQVMAAIQTFATIAPLDAPAGALAAELQYGRGVLSGRMKTLAAAHGTTSATARQMAKTDAMIVAVAIRHRATRLVTTDRHIEVLAGGRIRVEDVPSAIVQQILPLPSPAGAVPARP